MDSTAAGTYTCAGALSPTTVAVAAMFPLPLSMVVAAADQNGHGGIALLVAM